MKTSDSPTHFLDVYRHNLDIINIALLKISNLNYSNQNVSELSFDHNPVLVNFKKQHHRSYPIFHTKTLTNWNRSAHTLHKSILNLNPTIDSKASLNNAVANIIVTIQEALSFFSTTIIIDSHKDLKFDIKTQPC